MAKGYSYHEHLAPDVALRLAARDALQARRFREAISAGATTEWVRRDHLGHWVLAQIDPEWRSHLAPEDLEAGARHLAANNGRP